VNVTYFTELLAASRYDRSMSAGTMLEARPTNPQVLPRICSGACPFFVTLYDQGRKVPGKGVCMNHGTEMTVQVGARCAWKLSRFSRRRPEDLDG
jgi:hypothetical protein